VEKNIDYVKTRDFCRVAVNDILNESENSLKKF